MGATLDETRLELEEQRAKVRGTAERLESATRRSLDVRAMIGRNPARTIGLAAGAAFFLLGGPHRTVRMVRRAFGAAADGEKAYAALPPSLRALVDDVAPGFGASKADAKGEMALALHAWREDPKNRKKANRLISETLTPPGPSRTFWALVEVAGVTAAGIVAKQVVGRSLASGAFGALLGRAGPKAETEPKVVTEPNARVELKAKVEPKTKTKVEPKAPTGSSPTGYTGWSGRQASVAGPARDPAAPAEKRP
ncbi:MAG TPA: hypothetical protein VJ839_01410 [Candidatus Limnocylindria bacterium]|nr:hypothetical protein [Candidatus Limnocylindria bacterium]